KGQARRGPTLREAVLMHGIARLAFHPLITNIQASWVKLGIEGLKLCLASGANDLGGTLMNESISRAAGTQHGQELPPTAMAQIAEALGRHAEQRDTLYRPVQPDRVKASLTAPPLDEIVQTPPGDAAALSRRRPRSAAGWPARRSRAATMALQPPAEPSSCSPCPMRRTVPRSRPRSRRSPARFWWTSPCP